MPTRRETEAILKANEDRARERYRQARAEFDSFIAGFPSGLPETDGALRIRQAGAAMRAALEAVNEARISLDNFKIPGFRQYDLELAEADSVLDQSNRNFMEFVKRDIELGFTFLQTAQVEKDMGEKEASDQSLQDARTALDGARHFLDKIYSLIPGERESLRIQIAKLEAAIEDFRALQT
jgi:multidrug resistance efflux pump